VAPTSPELLAALLDGLAEPVMFVDADHVIRYMNKAALTHYKQGAALLGTSLMDCHNEQSEAQIREIWARLQAGEEEVLYHEKPHVRLYMRGVRDAEGGLIGYTERQEKRGE
jgi:nitrogen-specific signal transduction histidine kinase